MSFLQLSLLLFSFYLCHGVPLESPSEDFSPFFPRIVGGEDAPKGSAPHMAALVISQTIPMFVCGGSIIGTKHIMTAAHCIDMFVIWGELLETYHAIVGTNDWFHKGIDARVAEFYIHPQWDPQFIKNDIGMLILTEELQMTKKVGVIALNYDYILGDKDCYVTGWGRLGFWGIIPYKLQLLFVKTLSQEQCAKHLLEAPQWGNSPPMLDENLEICTYHSCGHGMCNGDSGSALVQTDTNEQIGIVSWGYACARCLPDVFVRVSAFKDFITQKLKI